MANTFLRKTSKAVGIAASDSTWWQVGANTAGALQTGRYEVAASTTTTVIGLSLTNVTGSSVDVDVAIGTTMADVASDISLASSVPIPSGSVLVLVGGDQKLNMVTGDLIKVKSSAAASLDVCMSVLEIT
jgi:hypothetical protein